MAIIRPLRGLRYNTRDPLSVALVTAPPYDCITPEEQEELYRTHPHNIVRLILGKETPLDDDKHNKYTRAASLLGKWRKAGILVRDHDPAVYFYQQEFEIEGRSYLREGFLARVGLEEFGTGRIFPHEETLPGPRADRLKLLRATRTHTEPIFSLFPDPANAVTAFFHQAGPCDPLAQTVDGNGVVHRLFGCNDAVILKRVREAMAEKPLFIADGHHRYETSLAYRKELEAAGEKVGPEHPANYILMLCVSMHHPGLAVLATHRVLSGLAGLTADRLRRATEEHFAWHELTGAEATSPRLLRHLNETPGHAFGLWTRDTATAFVLALKDPAVMDALAADRSPAWRRLDVAVLERVLLGHDLAKAVDRLDGLQRTYVYLAQQAFDAVHEDGADAALVLRPLPVQSLQDVAQTGERMPAKSTYFYPKALSGLVLNPLE
jgi:uncharacterized protein (DUF1015 family)